MLLKSPSGDNILDFRVHVSITALNQEESAWIRDPEPLNSAVMAIRVA